MHLSTSECAGQLMTKDLQAVKAGRFEGVWKGTLLL